MLMLKYVLVLFLVACGGTDPDLSDASMAPDANVQVDAADADVTPDADTRCGRVDFPCCPGNVCLDFAFSTCDLETNVCVGRPDAAP